MKNQIASVRDAVKEAGLIASAGANGAVKVEVVPEVFLVFQPDAEGLIVGFEGMPSHTHGAIDFTDPAGRFLELQPSEIPKALLAGAVLICERWVQGLVTDRWLVHRDFNDEFKYMDHNEELRIYRAKG